MRLGIDVGGTFTDLYCYDSEKNNGFVQKAPSTPDDFKTGVFNVIHKADINLNKIKYFIHGCTICTNAVIQRTCPDIFLITTEGFEDLLAIGRYHRPSLYDPYQQKPKPLVKRRFTLGIPERFSSTGEELKALDRSKAVEISKKIGESSVRSVCVAFQNSYANSKHEEEMKDILMEYNPGLFVSLSSTIPKIRELKRFTTAAIRAMLWPIMSDYVRELTEGLASRGFNGKLLFVSNNGGMIESKFAISRPELMLVSGPAAGIGGADFLAKEIGKQNIITADMGGTSCDVSIQEGKNNSLTMTTEREIDFDMTLNVPTVDVRTIGAGGGSIAWIDKGGSIRVGPQSSGAVPGPACYGRGGSEATVTDANLLLGRLGLDSMIGAGMKLDLEKAKSAVQKIANTLGLDVIETAQGIIRIVNENMAATIRQVSLERGRDPRGFGLMAAGAAGAMHAAFLAEIIGIPEVIIPRNAGVLSAFGCTVVDIRHDLEKTFYYKACDIPIEMLNDVYTTLNKETFKLLAEEEIPKRHAQVSRTAMMRYVGQTYEVETPVPLGKISENKLKKIVSNFHKEHLKEYGFSREGFPVAIVDVRNTVIGQLGKSRLVDLSNEISGKKLGNKGSRKVFFNECGFTETPVYNGEELRPGNSLDGPAVIEWRDFTAVVPPDRKCTVDKWQNLVMQI